MQYDFVLVDVFTDTPFGGNQLAVLPDANGLTSTQMQSIAREFNFAESTFVLPPDDRSNTARLRIFSPLTEMPFAGHPTVGTAAALVLRRLVPVREDGGAHLVFEEGVGPVRVTVTDGERGLRSELALDGDLTQPPYAPDGEALAKALSLPASAVRGAWFASVGLPFCFCHLATETDVDAAVLDKAAWSVALGDAWAQNLFFFSGELTDGGQVYARMFAPSIGIDEDPATGSAAAALIGYLASKPGRAVAAPTLTVRQGFAMGRPSVISAGAVVEGGRLQQVSVGGNVVQFGAGTVEVPE
jgi:trans-2,3-dihydro-3-hydroxyanthranilate isomerase